MNSLKIGISGVRGLVGETFTPELAVGFAQAFGTYLDSGRILVCRDARPSGPMVRSAVLAGLLASGCEVVDLGVCPTPSLQLAVRWLEADGGISITAGHNPEPWNALKFVRGDGLYLNALQADELLDIFHQGEFAKAGWERIRSAVEERDAITHHLEALSRAFDVEAIKSRRLTVAVDCCNSSCSYLSPRWLAALGCEVLAVNDDPNAPFPHAPEPTRRTMAQLRAVVKAGRANVGFAHDADGERLGVVTEEGEILGEEATLPLCAEIQLRRESGAVVTNVSTSAAVERVAERYGATVLRTPVGQAFISEAMSENRAVLGGEGSGGVIVPRVHLTHDSAAAVGLILEHMAQTGAKASELAASLPRLSMLKHYVEVEPNRIYSVLQRVYEELERERLPFDQTDGIKVQRPDGWVHVRVSNTESKIRVIAESDTESRAQELLDWARDLLGK
ncbi:MAG TPA: phosphoglucosamine mutase [Pyrinomonadaceae bacterium]|jgi:phosphomannomutase|nr:phosphoglucosamine mutase [Pyrinomonadaceae bacterium]